MVNAAERRRLNAAGIHRLAGTVARHRTFNTDNGGTEYFMSSNAADEATHPVAGIGGNYTSSQIVVWTLKNTASLNSASPRLSSEQQGAGRRTSTRIPPKQQQPGSGTPPTGRTAGLLHQRHDDRRRSPASAAGGSVRRSAGAQRGGLDARLERHPHAAGDVRERQAVGRARHGAQPGRRRAAGRHRLVRRQPERGQGRQPGLPRRGRLRLHLSGDRRHRKRTRRDGVHRHG